ncbi:hypothetical protein [Proteiniphilum sp.]|uniref:hypothetical protein n=1 Tax=Proteiniphilum sp. TaxID=1926877 RepID=UPI002B20DE5F|nr:hypothetical protein [Proteiniphilum sp.]MEA4916425.1 hypothetical protein [Proteiniphilum sp.]
MTNIALHCQLIIFTYENKSIFLTLVLVVTSFALSAQSIEGTWKLVEESNPLPEGFTNLKHITSTHFMWTIIDKDGNIATGAGGTYTLKDGVYIETVLFTLPGMQNLKGKKAIYKLNMDDKTMSLSGYIEFDENTRSPNSEKRERIE